MTEWKKFTLPLSLFKIDSLDFVTEWLQEAMVDLQSKVACANNNDAAAASKVPALSPVAVQNHAYIQLLKWNHLQKPFPEVTISVISEI